MNETELRSHNRALIRQLIDGQKAASRSSYDASKLGRDLNALQAKLEQMTMTRSAEAAMSSKSSPRYNTNNNNLTDSRCSSGLMFSGPAVCNVSPPMDDSFDSDSLRVVRSSPEESKAVRRKLAEEMGSPRPRQTSFADDVESPLKSNKASQVSAKRSVLRDLSNEFESPKKFTSATPKSILKHRRMIDDNVQVKSKFAHTPGWMERAKHTRVSAPSSSRSEQPTDKVVANRKLPSSVDKIQLPAAPSTRSPVLEDLADPEVLRADSSNLRFGSPAVKAALAQGEPSLDPNTMLTPTSLSMVRESPENPSQSVMRQRMMGYDWIAALLDQSDAQEMSDKHESYFRELKEFRRLHRDECEHDKITSSDRGVGSLLVDTADIAPRVAEPVSPNHTCIHSYTVNPRLYTVPMNGDKSGSSRCAVCNKREKLPSANSPSFVRVSIPRSTLCTPYRVKPHRRRSFDPSDSVALSKHCLAGWVHQRPLKLPVGRNVDLANETNRLKSKLTMTMAEAKDLAKRSKATNPVTSRDIDQTTLYSQEVKKVTNQLLDMSHAMQFQTQVLNKTPIH